MGRDRFSEIMSSVASRATMIAGQWDGFLWLDGSWMRAASADSLSATAAALSQAADEAGVEDTDTLLVRHGSAPVGPPLGRG
jgi:hypothetical protein